MHPSPRGTAAAVAALLIAGLAACGDGPSGHAIDHLAAGQTLDKAQVTEILRRATASVRTAHIEMDMDMHVNGRHAAMTAEGDVSSAPISERLTMDTGSGTMIVLLVDGVIYENAPQLPTGGKWLRVTTADMRALGLAGLSTAMTNPMGMMQQLAPYVSKAKYVGDELPGKHYRATMDVAGIAKKMGLPTSSSVKLPSSAREDFWIDDQGHLVRSYVDMAPLETVTITMSEFGEAVHVKAPPASRVTDMADLANPSVDG